MEVDAPAFPFRHRIEVTAIVREPELRVDTTIVPTGRRGVPIAFGWHPTLRLPGEPRHCWRLRLPARRHLALDDRGIPTGDVTPESAECEPVGRRSFDDGYDLDATAASHSKAMPVAPSSCDAERATRSHKCGFPVGGPSRRSSR